MYHCSKCGSECYTATPDGDDRDRSVCSNCGHIHYENPKIIVGTIPLIGSKVLLCERAIMPAFGKWTLPAGFLESGETIEAGALRETTEETQASVSITRLFCVANVRYLDQVHVYYLANLDNAQFGPTKESRQVLLFDIEQIPWSSIAFPVVLSVLRLIRDTNPHDNAITHHIDVQGEPLPM